jgi:hypothetical protein
MTGYMTHEANIARLDDFNRAGARCSAQRDPAPRGEVASRTEEAIAVRRATAADAGAIRRLAALDSADAPAGELLLAVVDGTPRAAIEIATGATIADPFQRTADVVELLGVRAARLRADAVCAGGRPIAARLRRRLLAGGR